MPIDSGLKNWSPGRADIASLETVNGSLSDRCVAFEDREATRLPPISPGELAQFSQGCVSGAVFVFTTTVEAPLPPLVREPMYSVAAWSEAPYRPTFSARRLLGRTESGKCVANWRGRAKRDQ
jgi:hypothetical protein